MYVLIVRRLTQFSEHLSNSNSLSSSLRRQDVVSLIQLWSLSGNILHKDSHGKVPQIYYNIIRNLLPNNYI